MKFGYFDDTNKEYVITSPKTPLPWINYLGSENFFSLISNTCGGYSFYKDAKLLRLTRYRYNNVPLDSNGHYYYVKDGDTIWNPGWMPSKTELDAYSCRHGMGYSVFKGTKNKLTAELTSFVPVGETCEVGKLSLTNESNEIRNFSVFSYVEFCLWNAMDDMTNFQRNFSTGEVEIHGSALYHKTEYRERRNHYAVYAVNAPIAGFDTDRDSFLGAYGENSAPEVVVNGTSKNSVASGWAPIGSHHLEVSLAPGETKTYVFVLGYVENPVEEKWVGRAEDGVINRKRADELLSRFDTAEKADAALVKLKDYWNELLSHFTISSSEEKLDRMVNTQVGKRRHKYRGSTLIYHSNRPITRPSRGHYSLAPGRTSHRAAGAGFHPVTCPRWNCRLSCVTLPVPHKLSYRVSWYHLSRPMSRVILTCSSSGRPDFSQNTRYQSMRW